MGEALTCDAVVIGGGPAGAAAAAVLAGKGRKAVVCEQDLFPRYHIGEVLLPGGRAALERLGLLERVQRAAFAVPRHGLNFVACDGTVAETFESSSQGWHVLRGEFDKLLLDRARAMGAEVREETEVLEVLFEGHAAVGVRARHASGTRLELRAPVTIDCSGRDGLAMAGQGWRETDPRLGKSAIWTYFIGAKRPAGIDGATTFVSIPGRGWFWYVPLPNDTVSAGLVADHAYLYREAQDPGDIFWREAEEHSWMAAQLDGAAEFGQFFSTSDFAYRSRHCATGGLVLAGDAFAFVDPIFSTGLCLALQSGVRAGEAVEAALQARDYGAAQFAAYGAELCRGVETLRKLTCAFYAPKFSLKKLLSKRPELHGQVADWLSGELFKDYAQLLAGLAEFTPEPESLNYGLPLAPVPA